MPTVKTYQPGQVQARGSSFTLAPIGRAAAFGGAQAEQIGQLGAAIGQAGQAVQAFDDRAARQKAQSDRINQGLQAQKDKLDARNELYDLRNINRAKAREIYARKGVNAKGAIDEMQDFSDKQRKSVQEKYKGRQSVLSYLTPSMNSNQGTHLDGISRHEVEQIDVADRASLSASIDGDIDDSILYKDDPAKLGEAERDMSLNVRALYTKEGFDSKAVGRKVKEMTHSMYSQVAREKAKDDAVGAKQWVRDNKKKFLATEYETLVDDIDKQAVNAEVISFSKNIYIPGEDLKVMLDKADKIKDPIVSKRVKKELKQLDKEAKANAEIKLEKEENELYDLLGANPIDTWGDKDFQLRKTNMPFESENRLEARYIRSRDKAINKGFVPPQDQETFTRLMTMPLSELNKTHLPPLGADMTEAHYDAIVRRKSGISEFKASSLQQSAKDAMTGFPRFSRDEGEDGARLRRQFLGEFEKRIHLIPEPERTTEKVNEVINNLMSPIDTGFTDFGLGEPEMQAFELPYVDVEERADIIQSEQEAVFKSTKAHMKRLGGELGKSSVDGTKVYHVFESENSRKVYDISGKYLRTERKK